MGNTSFEVREGGHAMEGDRSSAGTNAIHRGLPERFLLRSPSSLLAITSAGVRCTSGWRGMTLTEPTAWSIGRALHSIPLNKRFRTWRRRSLPSESGSRLWVRGRSSPGSPSCILELNGRRRARPAISCVVRISLPRAGDAIRQHIPCALAPSLWRRTT